MPVHQCRKLPAYPPGPVLQPAPRRQRGAKGKRAARAKAAAQGASLWGQSHPSKMEPQVLLSN
jgi:hypothetical protein